MIDPELLEILVCPETHQPVRLASETLVARVNDAVGAGLLKTRGGSALTEPLEAALVREDGLLLFPIRDGIPVMLLDEALLIDGLRDEEITPSSSSL